MTRVEERDRHARLQAEALARLGEDLAWSARRADCQLALRLRKEREAKQAAMVAAIGRQQDRWVALVNETLRPDMHAAATALLAAHVGLAQ